MARKKALRQAQSDTANTKRKTKQWIIVNNSFYLPKSLIIPYHSDWNFAKHYGMKNLLNYSPQIVQITQIFFQFKIVYNFSNPLTAFLSSKAFNDTLKTLFRCFQHDKNAVNKSAFNCSESYFPFWFLADCADFFYLIIC